MRGTAVHRMPGTALRRMPGTEVHRMRGEWLLAHRRHEQDQAEASFRRAHVLARQQGAKLWELRAATSLGRLWLSQGKRSDAYALLTPTYGLFTEGFNTPDLTEAKTLIGKPILT